MDESPKRLTLRDVALRAGVSSMTVSLALRDQPGLPKETRERIQKLADEMGYRPDPALAALNRYRSRVRQTVSGTTLVYLTAFETRDEWQTGFFKRTYEGAEKRATDLGYRLEHFWLREPGFTPERLAAILQNRGIRGILVAPLQRPGRLDFPWAGFSSVPIGPSLVEPALHSACNDHYQSMLLALSHLASAGYQRIGLILDPEVDQRHQQKYLAAFTMFQQGKCKAKDRVPPLLTHRPSEELVSRWMNSNSPDVVISHDDGVCEWLPEQMKFVSLIRSGDPRITGIETFPEQIAAAAVNRLNQLLHDNETGVPEHPTCLMVSGSWMLGETC